MDPNHQDKRDIRAASARMARGERIGGILLQSPMDEASKRKELDAQVEDIVRERQARQRLDDSYKWNVLVDYRLAV